MAHRQLIANDIAEIQPWAPTPKSPCLMVWESMRLIVRTCAKHFSTNLPFPRFSTLLSQSIRTILQLANPTFCAVHVMVMNCLVHITMRRTNPGTRPSNRGLLPHLGAVDEITPREQLSPRNRLFSLSCRTILIAYMLPNCHLSVPMWAAE